MGRNKLYDARRLENAIERYFRSITRERTVTEQIATGDRDERGHIIYETVPVLNRLGKEVTAIEYVVPPSVSDLCAFLKIDHTTWANYRDPDKNPALAAVAEKAFERMKAWNQHELVTRAGKDVRGIIFNLENNYGYREQKSVDVGGEGIEAYLRRLSENGEGVQEF